VSAAPALARGLKQLMS